MTFKEMAVRLSLENPSKVFDSAANLLSKYKGEDMDLIEPLLYEIAAKLLYVETDAN